MIGCTIPPDRAWAMVLHLFTVWFNRPIEPRMSALRHCHFGENELPVLLAIRQGAFLSSPQLEELPLKITLTCSLTRIFGNFKFWKYRPEGHYKETSLDSLYCKSCLVPWPRLRKNASIVDKSTYIVLKNSWNLGTPWQSPSAKISKNNLQFISHDNLLKFFSILFITLYFIIVSVSFILSSVEDFYFWHIFS